ncbi:MAG: cupin domain-containing protein [Sedimentisphaerales bacterium]|nr:cupin domain-containing protein [Sedimentisphaerales bacterium]
MSTENGGQEKVCSECLGRARTLSDLVEYVSGSIVSKTIADKEVGSITVFSFDKGQKLSEHQSPFDAVVQVVDGTAELRIGGGPVTVNQGQIIIMPANVPHSVSAEEKFKMLLTMLRA